MSNSSSSSSSSSSSLSATTSSEKPSKKGKKENAHEMKIMKSTRVLKEKSEDAPINPLLQDWESFRISDALKTGIYRNPSSLLDFQNYNFPSLQEELKDCIEKFENSSSFLRILAISGSDLAIKDPEVKSSDPYIKIFSHTLGSHPQVKKLWTSSIHYRNLKPKWEDANGIFDMEDLKLEKSTNLVFEIFDKDVLSDDDFMGVVELNPLIMYFLWETYKKTTKRDGAASFSIKFSVLGYASVYKIHKKVKSRTNSQNVRAARSRLKEEVSGTLKITYTFDQ